MEKIRYLISSHNFTEANIELENYFVNNENNDRKSIQKLRLEIAEKSGNFELIIKQLFSKIKNYDGKKRSDIFLLIAFFYSQINKREETKRFFELFSNNRPAIDFENENIYLRVIIFLQNIEGLKHSDKWVSETMTEELRSELKKIRILLEAADSYDFSDDQQANEFMHRLSKGLYHNFPMRDGRNTFDLGEIRVNSHYSFKEQISEKWFIIESLVGELKGKKLLDIGSADGYFSLKAALAGASVTALEKYILFYVRSRLVFRYYGVETQINQVFGEFNRNFYITGKRFDIVLALGVIYHFNDILFHLNNLIELSDNILIETRTAPVIWENDKEAMRYREGDPLDFDWVCNHFKKAGYQAKFSEKWAAISNRDEKQSGRRLVYFWK